MSKVVLISIQPKWCGLIASGRKTVELRKTKPKIECPFKCYIYCTNDPKLKFWTGPRYAYADDHSHNAFDRCGNGKVIGEFVCNVILRHCEMANADIAEIQGLVRRDKIPEYANGKEVFGWHISDLVIYDTPKELGEFMKPCENDLYCEVCAMYHEFTERCGNKALMLSRAPQSWCYVEELEEGGADHA